MEKVLFLIFLLFLGLGTANVKAQVRIGGNVAPNAAAALDLNATDATNNGTKGLALPRVNLTSDTMHLTTGVTNVTGMLVYNTATTLGTGIYSWTGSTWKKVDALPDPTPADSGFFLMSTGSGVRFMSLINAAVWNTDSIKTIHPARPTTVSVVVDTTVTLDGSRNSYINVDVAGVSAGDFCYSKASRGLFLAWANNNQVVFWNAGNNFSSLAMGFRCLRFAF